MDTWLSDPNLAYLESLMSRILILRVPFLAIQYLSCSVEIAALRYNAIFYKPRIFAHLLNAVVCTVLAYLSQ